MGVHACILRILEHTEFYTNGFDFLAAKHAKTFDGVEKSLVYLIMAMAFFSAIGGRYNVGWPIFIHLLQTGTCSAMCFAYCFAEWIKEKKDKKRLRFSERSC